ncbi:MAG: hypothetical protein ABJK20_10885 [Halieaceae bacterium]
MVEASELKRLAYLQAMGVDSYVSRQSLPAAAVSRRLMVVAKAPLAAPEKPLESVASGFVDIDLGRDSRPAAKPAAVVAQAKPAAAPPEAFSIAAIIVGGWLWLEELPGAVLASEQVQLITAISRALGLPQAQPAVAQFDWPIHTNQQFDLGPEAAASSLQGFVQRQLTDFNIAAVVLLGDECQTRLSAQQLNAAQLLTTVSTRNMLEQCGLKRQAWRDLGPYASKS